MLANNETGVIQPVAEAAALCRRHGALLHVDAVQAAGRMPVDLAALGAHSLAISSHKLGGPPGAGALLLAPDVSAHRTADRRRRPGTRPARRHPAAARHRRLRRRGRGSRRRLTPICRRCGTRSRPRRALQVRVVCGGGAPRLPNTTCLALPGVRADAQVIALDLDGIAVSAGAACSSGKVTASHVLAAMGLGALAGQAIRVSLPWNATEADVEAFVAAYARMADRLRDALAPRAA